MKLYYSPGACSLASRIVLEEAGLQFQGVKASTKTHQLEDGTDFYSINPNGYVPVLELDDGTRLFEGPAINQYLADLAPQTKLAPANGSLARYQLQGWLNFLGTEVHKNYSPLWNPNATDDAKAAAKAMLAKRLGYIDAELGKKGPFLMGDTFTIADAYLFVVTNWSSMLDVDMSAFKNLNALRAKVAERPSVQKAMKDEGLLG